MNTYYVYIMSCDNNSTIYIGITGNLIRRVYEHKNGLFENSYTDMYHIHKLIYFEETSSIENAISREKQLKRWTRAKKNALINSVNPKWVDLSILLNFSQ